MKIFNLNYSIFLLLAVAVCSCSKEGPQGPAGDDGKYTEGLIEGYAHAYDQFGREVLADKNNILFKVEDTNPVISGSTNDKGKVSLNHIPFGTYNLLFSKNEYATTKILGFNVLGDSAINTFGTINLVQKSTVKYSNLAVELLNGYRWYFTFNTDQTKKDEFILRYFLSTSPEVSRDNYLYTGIKYSTNSNQIMNIDQYPGNFSFASGTKLYFCFYGYNPRDYGFTNLQTGLMEYSSMSDTGTNVVELTMP